MPLSTKKHSEKRGFTLMEIMVVLSIATMLLTVVMFSISSAREKSRDGKRISDISQLRLSLEQYYDACGNYPYKLVSTVNNGCVGATTFGNFIAQIPTDPNGSSYYYYASGVATDCYNYHIGATLENGSHAELSNDSDVTAEAGVVPGTKCEFGGATDGQNWLTGAGNVYDFIPSR